MIDGDEGRPNPPCALRPSNGLEALPDEEGWTSRIGEGRKPCWFNEKNEGLFEQFYN